MEPWQTKTGLTREEFEKLTLYTCRSDNALDNRNRAVIMGLTAEGTQLALRILRRHRLIELFLTEALEMGWDEVHDRVGFGRFYCHFH